jgi:hypothetical protein
MAAKVDKVIVTNFGALTGKYDAAGIRDIRAALGRLITADKARGLQTILIGVDDPRRMRALSSPAVVNPASTKENKAAIDGIYRALTPDYILILGSRDVIPHQDLKNPLFKRRNGDDPDKYAWGDLPYACDVPYSQMPGKFVGPTRVVGRLPDITGGDDPKYLVGLLKTAANYKSQDRDVYENYFAVTAQVWEASTALSLRETFKDDTRMQKVPPRTFRWSASLIKNRTHFFNCHGAPDSSRYYGQPINRKATYPFALDATYMDGKIQEGTIAAAECCYGGQLYALSAVQRRVGMCNVYLKNRSYGFFASTTIAYGPARTNGQADLICQYFIQSLLRGASLGRAALEARQNFASQAKKMDPSDYKTLAQFNLYGDPSLQPVQRGTGAPAMRAATQIASRSARHERRRALIVQGRAIAGSAPRISRSPRKAPASIERELRSRARRFVAKPGDFLSFVVQHPRRHGLMPKALAAKQSLPNAYHVLLSTIPPKRQRKPGPPFRRIVGIIGKEVGGKLASVSEIHSR